MKSNLIYAWLLFGTLCSCSVYRKYECPATLQTDVFCQETLTDTIDIASLSWKDFFSDTCLQVLIGQGLQNNTDLKIAYLRIEEAQAALQASKLAFVPSLSLTADGTLRSFDRAKTTKSYSAGLSSDWEIDISGKKANQLRSDRVEVFRADANRQAVHSQLIASIADSYFSLLMLDKQLEISERTLVSWDKTIRILKVLKKAGKTDEAAINQADANRLEVEGNIVSLKKQIKNGENALVSLLGCAPRPIMRGDLSQQAFTSELHKGIPLQLLRNRPDVRQYEYDLEQAFYATNMARAAFYPNITLSGNAGWTNNNGIAIVNPGGMLFNAVASLVQPLFNRGTNIANLKISKAQQEEALLLFQQKLLDAAIEVNDALIGWQSAHEQADIDRKRVAALQKAVNNTKLTMQYGNTTYLEVLTAEQALLQAELNEVTDQYSEFQNIITLYYALGGGIE